MHSHVALERKSLCKALAAHETGVCSDAGVCDHVVVEVMRHGEWTAAHITLERFVATV